MYPKVVFVDGPTGVGKGYFIQNFIETYKKNFPEKKVKIIIATDYALRGSATSELRKYTEYNTEKEKIDGIFSGHMELISDVQKFLNSNEEETPDLILVDRSFLTFLSYNVYKDEQEELRKELITKFETHVKATLSTVDPLFVYLDVPFEDERRAVNILLTRIANRRDNKPVDINWIYTLIGNYRKFNAEVGEVFDYFEPTDSGEFENVFNRYFK